MREILTSGSVGGLVEQSPILPGRSFGQGVEPDRNKPDRLFSYGRHCVSGGNPIGLATLIALEFVLVDDRWFHHAYTELLIITKSQPTRRHTSPWRQGSRRCFAVSVFDL